MKYKINFAGIELKNQVFVASGIIGFGEEYSNVFDINKLGGIITKTITLKPRKGNAMPRIVETASGMINTIGLENPGVDKFLEEKVPFIQKNIKTAVIVSVGGESPEEFLEILKKIEGISCISAVELNLSCPNVGLNKGIQLISQNPQAAYNVVNKVKMNTKYPVIAKLTPAVNDINEIALACERAGADGLALINTVPGYSETFKGSPIIGGLSGPAIKPVALRAVYNVSKNVKIPIMGVGGINSYDDVLDFFVAGAKVVAVGSAMFRNPNLPLEIIAKL